jgi:hypothetical protein
MSAVIDAKAYARITGHIKRAKENTRTHEIIAGGTFDDSKGYFIQPTIVTVKDPLDKIMTEVCCCFEDDFMKSTIFTGNLRSRIANLCISGCTS